LATSAQQRLPAPTGHQPDRPGATAFRLVENDIGEGVTLVQVVGELDAAVIDQLIEIVERVPSSQETIVLGLDECEFIDSSGIAAILHFHRELAEESRRLVLCAPRGPVRRLLEMTGVARPELVAASLEQLPLSQASR
jgi:anti-anti-sigma factor